jgi:hypothetical protein
VLGQLRGGADHIFIRRGTVAVIAQIQLPGDVLALQGLPLILDIQFPSEGVTHAAFISAHLIRLPIRCLEIVWRCGLGRYVGHD